MKKKSAKEELVRLWLQVAPEKLKKILKKDSKLKVEVGEWLLFIAKAIRDSEREIIKNYGHLVDAFNTIADAAKELENKLKKLNKEKS